MPILQTIEDITARHYVEFARRLSERVVTKQQTLGKPVKLFGCEPLGGRDIEITLYPAKPNTGKWFVLSDEDLGLEGKLKEGDEVDIKDFPPESLLKADIRNASYNYSGILLSDKGLRLLYPEHVLGASYAYGVDNLVVHVRRFLSEEDLKKRGKPVGKWHSLASINKDSSLELRYFGIFAIPFWENVTLEVVKAITEAGLKEQGDHLTYYTIGQSFNFTLPPSKEKYRGWQQQMRLRHAEGGLVIKATTDYGHESPLQEVELRIDPLTFLTEVSEARSLLKDRYLLGYPVPLNIAQYLAKIGNPEFGYGSGLTANQLVLPNQKAKERYGNRDRYIHDGPSEIARHNILDRLGELALLGFPLTEVHFESNRLRHEGSLQGLRKALDDGKFVRV